MLRSDIPTDPTKDPEGVCSLACTGYPNFCKSWTLRADRQACVLFTATLDSQNSWASIGKNKTAEAPGPTYTTKPLRHSFTMQNGGIDWVNMPTQSGGGGCGGFNGWGANAGSNLGFGTIYNNRCPSRFLLNYCPKNFGTLVSGGYSNPDGGACDSGGTGCIGGDVETNLNVKCGFKDLDVSKFISAGLFNDSLGKSVFATETWSQIKDDYCAKTENVDSPQCTHWLDTFGTPSCESNPFDCSQLSYNSSKLAICNSGQNWTGTPSCISTVNNVMKTGLQAEQTTATTMVQNFCDAHVNDPLCGCYNVTKYGSQCISDDSKKTLPGCDNLNTDFRGLPSFASIIGADKFCASSDCITNALSSSSELMPVPRASATSCPPIQACIQNFQGAVLNNSEVSASCKQTLNISTTPPPSGTPASGTPPSGTPPSDTTPSGTPASGTPSPPATTGSDGSTLPITNPTVANVLDTSTKQYAAMGGVACLILICCILFLVLATSGGD